VTRLAAPSRRPGKPYRVLVSLLYSRFAWAERGPDGSVRANSVQYARALGLRTASFHEALAQLKEQGYLDRLVWHRGWFLALPRCPEGLARLTIPHDSGPPADPVNIADVPETIDVEAAL
jgi:hypothetical protein